MIKKTISYKTYDGALITEDFYFNFTEAEIMEMQYGEYGGFSQRVQKMIDTHDQPGLIKLIKEFVLDAYGVKSADGKRFQKNEELKRAFVECPAYSILFMELALDDVKAADFVRGVVPENMKDEVSKATNEAKLHLSTETAN